MLADTFMRSTAYCWNSSVYCPFLSFFCTLQPPSLQSVTLPHCLILGGQSTTSKLQLATTAKTTTILTLICTDPHGKRDGTTCSWRAVSGGCYPVTLYAKWQKSRVAAPKAQFIKAADDYPAFRSCM